MSTEHLIRCAVTFQTAEGGTDHKVVLLRGSVTYATIREEARTALYRQHDISGATVTATRLADACGAVTRPREPVEGAAA